MFSCTLISLISIDGSFFYYKGPYAKGVDLKLFASLPSDYVLVKQSVDGLIEDISDDDIIELPCDFKFIRHAQYNRGLSLSSSSL